jgi:Ricin-type beta-trefoil lectin domain-like
MRSWVAPIALSCAALCCTKPLDLGKLGPAAQEGTSLTDLDATALYATTIGNLRTQKYIDVANASTDEGAPLVQFGLHGGESQAWWFLWAERNYYYIVNAQSEKCIGIPNWSKEDLIQAVQSTCKGGTNQQWEPIAKCRGGKAYWELRNRNSQKVLDAEGSGKADGVRIIQWPAKNDAVNDAGTSAADNQLWFMTGEQWSDCGPDVAR